MHVRVLPRNIRYNRNAKTGLVVTVVFHCCSRDPDGPPRRTEPEAFRAWWLDVANIGLGSKNLVQSKAWGALSVIDAMQRGTAEEALLRQCDGFFDVTLEKMWLDQYLWDNISTRGFAGERRGLPHWICWVLSPPGFGWLWVRGYDAACSTSRDSRRGVDGVSSHGITRWWITISNPGNGSMPNLQTLEGAAADLSQVLWSTFEEETPIVFCGHWSDPTNGLGLWELAFSGCVSSWHLQKKHTDKSSYVCIYMQVRRCKKRKNEWVSEWVSQRERERGRPWTTINHTQTKTVCMCPNRSPKWVQGKWKEEHLCLRPEAGYTLGTSGNQNRHLGTSGMLQLPPESMSPWNMLWFSNCSWKVNRWRSPNMSKAFAKHLR